MSRLARLSSVRPEPDAGVARSSSAAAGVKRRELLGIPVAVTDYDEAMAEMDRLVETREKGYFCAAPVHAVMVAQDEPETLAALRGSTMVVPDGMPLVWALNMLGGQL